MQIEDDGILMAGSTSGDWFNTKSYEVDPMAVKLDASNRSRVIWSWQVRIHEKRVVAELRIRYSVGVIGHHPVGRVSRVWGLARVKIGPQRWGQSRMDKN